MRDMRELAKFEDGMSYLYVERCKIEQDKLAIALFDEEGKVPVPCAGLALLMLGPGTSITHAAIKTLADNGVLIAWAGEDGIRFYAQGQGKTRSAGNIIKQARLVSDSTLRLKVVENMYRMRFKEELEPGLTIQQLRGMEGARVRAVYARASKETGLPWRGRQYNRENWDASDPVNRALSSANACLYGICHAAIIQSGYSPALGFIHTGKQLSFVYDIADLYKAEITIPLAFKLAKEGSKDIDRRSRMACRDSFRREKLLSRIIPDIQKALRAGTEGNEEPADEIEAELLDAETSCPAGLWDPDTGRVSRGQNYSRDDRIGVEIAVVDPDSSSSDGKGTRFGNGPDENNDSHDTCT